MTLVDFRNIVTLLIQHQSGHCIAEILWHSRLSSYRDPFVFGKTTLSEGLAHKYGARIIKTRELLDVEARFRFKFLKTREEYQAFGDLLDAETKGSWVAGALAEVLSKELHELIIIDSVRTKSQIRAMRQEYKFAVFHLHLKAVYEDLGQRFSSRTGKIAEFSSYEESTSNSTESRVPLLEATADAVVDTSRCVAADVLIRAETHLRLYPRDYRSLSTSGPKVSLNWLLSNSGNSGSFSRQGE